MNVRIESGELRVYIANEGKLEALNDSLPATTPPRSLTNNHMQVIGSGLLRPR